MLNDCTVFYPPKERGDHGFSAKKDLLQQLPGLNRAVADREKNGLPVTTPGVPPSYGDPVALITDDCIRP